MAEVNSLTENGIRQITDSLSNQLNNKAEDNHNHNTAYYTKSEVDVIVSGVGGSGQNLEINALDYVSGNGTDETTGFRAAIDAAKSASTFGGGTVVLPPDRTILTRPFTMPSRVGIRGSGWSSRIKRVTTSETTGPFVTNELETSEQIWLSDLVLDCNNVGDATSHGVHFTNTVLPDFNIREFADQINTLQNLIIKNCVGWAVKTEHQTRETVMVNVQMRNCGEGGYWNDGTDGSTVACIVSGGSVAGFYDTGSSNRYTGCKVFYTGAETPPSTYDPDTAGAGFKLLDSYKTTLTGCEAQDCHVGFLVSKSEHFSLAGCHASSNYHVGLDLGGAGDYLHHGIVTGMRISGNKMRWTAGMRTAGIRVSNAFYGFIQAHVDNNPPSRVGTGPCIVETSAGLLRSRTSGLVTATDSTRQNLLPAPELLLGAYGTVSDETTVVTHNDAGGTAGSSYGWLTQFGSAITKRAGMIVRTASAWANDTAVEFWTRSADYGYRKVGGFTSHGYLEINSQTSGDTPIWLRRSGTTFQVSFDKGTTWNTVTLT